MSGRRAAAPFDVAGAVNGLRQAVSKADAMVHAMEGMIEGAWGDDDGNDRRWERLGHLVGGAVDALREALATGDHIAAQLAERRKGV